MRFLLVSLVAGMAPFAVAETVACRARVALNRIYDVTLDAETGRMTVRNDAGTSAAGLANGYKSGGSGDTSWFLATGFGTGFLLDVDAGGRMALCLADTECYACR